MAPGKWKNKNKNPRKKSVISLTGSVTAGLPNVEGFTSDIANADGWNAVVDHLCLFLKIPDLSTRRGLKLVYKDFLEISVKLSKMFLSHVDDDRIVGGIIGIYAKMCADVRLAEFLFDQGLILKILSLLDRPFCRHVALQAYTSIAHHTFTFDRSTCQEEISILLRLLEENPSDPKLAELCVVIISQSSMGLVLSGLVEFKPEYSKFSKDKFQVPRILRVFIENIKKPSASLFLLECAHEFLFRATTTCSEEFHDFMPAIDWLVACTRSRDITKRFRAMDGLHQLQSVRKEYAASKIDVIAFCRRFYDAGEKFPDYILYALGDHKSACEMNYILQYGTMSSMAIIRIYTFREYYEVGVKYADFILKTEAPILSGPFLDPSFRRFADTPVPVEEFKDILPLCARSIRERSSDSRHCDMADVLDLKWMMLSGLFNELRTHALRAIQRNPRHGFFYLALASCCSEAEGLRVAKRGLKLCDQKDMTPFVKYSLRFVSAEHAARLGMRLIVDDSGTASAIGTPVKVDNSEEANRYWGQGLAFMTSALNDFKIYIDEASPDTRNMRLALYWYSNLFFQLKARGVDDDLREIQDIRKKLQAVDKLRTFIEGRPPAKTPKRLICETILDRMPHAIKEWSGVVSRWDDLTESDPESTTFTPDKDVVEGLSKWLNGVNLDDDQEEIGNQYKDGVLLPPPGYRRTIQTSHQFNRRVVPNAVELYMCSFCRNPSATLKKCSGCGKARYCDSFCQRDHWKNHKSSCRASAK